MTFRELVFYTLLLGAGLLIGNLAHADDMADHFWISANPKYVERWRHQTHCCGPEHCRPLAELQGITVQPLPNGDWVVGGGRMAKPEVIPAADIYETEKAGGAQIWLCLWAGGPNGERVACLFIPPPQT